MSARLTFVLALGAVLIAGAVPAKSQLLESRPSPNVLPARSPAVDTVGIGIQAGWPLGLVLQVRRPARTYDLLLAWRLDRFVLAQGHARLVERPLPGNTPGRWYIGPGVAISGRDGRLRGGLSGEAGVSYQWGRVVWYLQLAPRVDLIPATRAHLTAGAGLQVLF